MPNNDYILKVHAALKDNLDGFDKTPEEFESAMQDSNYAKKVFVALKDNLADFNKDESQFLDSVYGPSVKKKDTPIQSTFGGSASHTQNTKTDASATQSQPADPSVNNQFNMMSFRNPLPETPIAHEEKVAYAKKAYRNNPLVPQGISDEDLHTAIEKNVTKNPDAFNQLAHQVKRKEERDIHIANASFDELLAQRDSELEHAQKTNTFYEYQQSRFGKAISYLNDIKDGVNISEKDAEYIKSVAPTAFNELVPNGDLQTAINVNRANKQANDAANAYTFNEAKKAYLTQANIIDATQIATMSDQVKVGEVSAKQNQQKDVEIKNLQLKYPLRQIGNTNYYNEMSTQMDFPPEYYAELKKVNEKYDSIGNYLGSVHGTEFAKTQKDGIVSGAKSAYDIGIESLKIQNKNTYEQYLSGGQKSQEVKAIATKLGIESMLATGDPEIIRKAQVEQSDFFKKYPKELADDTIRRLSVEYFRHKGISRIVNDVTVPTSELNKIAENLPQQNKDWYYANIATTRDPRKLLGATTVIGNSGLSEESTNKNYATTSVQLMNPGGSINSLLEGFINPFIATSKLVGDIVGARSKKEIANENLSGQPILDQNPFNESETNSKIKEIESKPKKTYQDLVELQKAKEVKGAIPFGADVINRVSSTVGMVGAIALQSNMLAGAVGSIAGVSQEGLSAMQQGIQTETSAAEIAKYATQLKNIGAGTGQVAMAATMADDMYKSAIRLMPNDSQATQRVAYTALLTTMWGAVSRIMPFEKVFKGLTPEAESELANLAKEVTQKSVTKEALTSSLGNILDKYVLPFAKGTATDLAKVTAEMTGAQVITQAADAVANPSEFNPEAAKEAVVHTLLNTPIDMILVAGMNGIREVSKNQMSIATLSSLSDEKIGQQFIEVVQAQMQKGDITPKEATEKIQIVNTLQEISKKEMPEVQAIKNLTSKESDMYKVLLLNEKILRKKMEDSKDAVLNKVYDSQIKESEVKRQNILGEEYIVDSNYNLKSVEDANKEMSNTESVATNGTSEVQGEFKTNTETVTGNNQTKNAEVGSGSEASGKVDATAETAPTKDEITVGDMVDKVGTYKGEKGRFYQDGQSVVFKVDGQNKEYELGNVSEISNTPISSFGIVHEESVVNLNDVGNVVVRGEEYKNNYSDPIQAINRDKDGNVVSVNLETPDGKKRTFRGNIAEDIAYQIHLKEITKDNGTKSEFEQFINEGEASKEMDNAGLSETPTTTTTENDGTVSREKIEPKTVAEFVDRISKGEQMTTPEELQFYENNKSEIEKALSKKAKLESKPTNSSEPLKDIESTTKALSKLDKDNPDLHDELKLKNTLDNYDIKDTEIPDGIENELFWQQKLVEKALKDNGVEFNKGGSKTSSSTYYTVETKEGDSFKIRVADHDLKYDSDANIQYDESTTPEEILEKLSNELPDGKILKNTSIAEEYHKQKSYKNITNPDLVKAVEQALYTQEVKSSEPIAEQSKSESKINFSFDPKTNEVLGTPEIEITSEGKKIGQLRTYTSEENPDVLITNGIEVNPKFQKQGAAKEAYIQLAKNNPEKTIKSSGQLTDGAKGVWESLVRDGIAEKVGENKYEIKPKSEVIDKLESISKDYEDISSMKAEKVKREAMDRLISDNFEDIVKQLISNEKIKKLC